MSKVLYIHGMGGGGDSRIPSILRECFSHPAPSACHPEQSEESSPSVEVIVRTYDFDPEKASEQIASWVEEIKPDLVIGESLGALQALRIRGVPHLFVSPALNTSYYFEALAWLTLIPGVTWIFDRIYKPKDGDRQKLHFTYRVLRKYRNHRRLALKNTPRLGSKEVFHAFFGTRDHYRKSGIVRIKTWKKHFGSTYTLYDGTHFMEEEFVRTILVDEVLDVLNSNK